MIVRHVRACWLLSFSIHINLLSLVLCDFSERLLEQHNELRAVHNTGPLKLDDDLTKKANEIVRQAAKNGNFIENEQSPGVNTMMVCASFKRKEDAAKEVAASW